MDTLLTRGGARRAALRLAADPARLDRAGLSVRFRVRGRPATGAAVAAGRPAARAAAAVRARRRLLPAPAVLLAVEDARRLDERGARAALRLRRAAGDRCDAALRARPAVACRKELDALGGCHRARDRRRDALRLGVGPSPHACRRLSHPGSTRRPARASRCSRSRPSSWPERSRARGSAMRRAARRHRLEIAAGAGLLLVGGVLALVLRGRVDFWGPSPAYVFVRLGALLLLLRVVEAAATGGSRASAPSRCSATRRCSCTCCT